MENSLHEMKSKYADGRALLYIHLLEFLEFFL